METLSELRDALETSFRVADSDRTRELMDQLDSYIDARIMVATKQPVPIIAQVVCPCIWRDGKFVELCALHEAEVRRRAAAMVR